MNLTLLALRAHVPVHLKRTKLVSLFEATAVAFDAVMPVLDHLSFEQCLETYALFTKEEVERKMHSGQNMSEVRDALYRHAYSLGSELREALRVKNVKDVISAGRALYRAIGIDFEGDSTGSIVIHSCFFSQFYSEAVCRVMSSLDEGIAAGLSGGGRLTFSQRITEGQLQCEASLNFERGAE